MWEELFDHASFTSRNHCGSWSDWLIQVNQFSNLSIFIAYTTISIMLGYLWYTRKQDIYNHWIVLCFVGFIFACGITHLCNFISFHAAPYRFFTLVDAITAII